MSTLYVDNLQPNLGSRVMAAGHVVQVVSAETNSQVQNTTTSYIDTGLTATITPTSASSKILILVSQAFTLLSSPDTNNQKQANLVITDGSNTILFGGSGYDQFRVKEQFAFAWQANLQTTHSPSTTSAITYKTRLKQMFGTNLIVSTQYNNNPSSITLMEIAQ